MEKHLEALRKQIDTLDHELCRLFCHRMHIVKKIICVKMENNIEITDRNRETSILEKHLTALNDKSLAMECKAFLSSLIAISKDYQQRLAGEHQHHEQT